MVNATLLSILFASLQLWAGQYYVSPNGADSNPGTSTAPFRTIQHAADLVNPGDTVIVSDGLYSDAAKTGPGSSLVNVTRGGRADSYVTFTSEHHWGAILNGLNNTTAEGWTFAASYVRVQNFEIVGFSDTALDNYRGGRFIEITGNHIHHIGNYCTDTTIGRDGIFISKGDVIIAGNLIHDIGRFSPGQNGCRPATSYYQNADHGIYIANGAANVQIQNNTFFNIGHGWAIQVYPNPVDNLSILNNTFGCANPWQPGQILLTVPVTHSRIANNTFYRPHVAAIYFDPADGKLPTRNDLSIDNNVTTNNVSQLYISSTGQLTINASIPGVRYLTNQEHRDISREGDWTNCSR